MSLHSIAEVAKDVLALIGAVSLLFTTATKLHSWHNRRQEKKFGKLEKAIYAYLMQSSDPHTVGGIYAKVVLAPLLDGIKLKHLVRYNSFPGWKNWRDIRYWSMAVWWRKLGSASEGQVAELLVDMRREIYQHVQHERYLDASVTCCRTYCTNYLGITLRL